MNAPAKILSEAALATARDVLEIRAQVRACLEYEYQFEHLADAVDPLQEYAERSGLVAALRQDAVQDIIAAPFARFRDIAAAEIAAEDDQSAELEPCEHCGFTIDQHRRVDTGEVLEFFCTEEEPQLDYAARIMAQWELADPRDSWRHTGEKVPPFQLRNSETTTRHSIESYRKPQATIEAFKHVIGLGDPDYLADWLRDHPKDARYLVEEIG
jgi:hypothetical protein